MCHLSCISRLQSEVYLYANISVGQFKNLVRGSSGLHMSGMLKVNVFIICQASVYTSV